MVLILTSTPTLVLVPIALQPLMSFHWAILLTIMLLVKSILALSKAPEAYKLVPSCIKLFTMLLSPLPRVDQLFPVLFHLAIRFAVIPPAIAKFPAI